MLEGNGARIVRLAARIQRALERLYQIDPLDDVGDFIHVGDSGERERLFIRDAGEGIFEIQVRLPPIDAGLDAICQVIEGVSHFVYVADRARIERPATQLELEMQAEVDKYVVLTASMNSPDTHASRELRMRLYENVRFTEEAGERYRIANGAAHRFVRALERTYVAEKKFVEMRGALRKFFAGNQEDKLRLAQGTS